PTETAATETTPEHQRYSTDPFDPNFRFISTWNEEQRANYLTTAGIPLSANLFDLYESVEHAEFARPMEQLQVRLRQRGLEGQVDRIMNHRDAALLESVAVAPFEDRRRNLENAMRFLRDSGEEEEFLEWVNEILQTTLLRSQVLMEEVPIQRLLEAGDVVGHAFIQMERAINPW
ncbi:hypothetical protein BU23DRAFT_398176, partial [Bimuria novae-zelandiae CBS 107.79]